MAGGLKQRGTAPKEHTDEPQPAIVIATARSSAADRDREIASTWHQRTTDEWAGNFNATIQYGLEAIRTAVFINGGAVIACLTFLGTSIFGATAGSEPTAAETAFRSVVFEAMYLFIYGAVISGAASGCAYFAQYLYTRKIGQLKLDWKHPYALETDASEKSNRFAVIWHCITIGLVILSYVLLCIAVKKIGDGYFAGV